MPWTVKDVDSYKKGLTDKQKRQWVAVANSSYQKCIDDGGTDKTCAPKAITIANGTVKEAKAMPPLIEKGRVYNKNNEGLIRQAFSLLKKALAALGDEGEDTDNETAKSNEKVKEAKGWSSSDLYAALNRELQDIETNAYIQDIFDDTIVYQKGWSGSYQQRSYKLDDTGVAEFGDPIEVSRKVTYVPTSDNEPPTISPPMLMADESAEIELEGDSVKLVEKAVNPAGEVMLKLISPGWGSSGYYSKEVLQRDGPQVFKKGLHNFIDHPTAQEESQRPEGSLMRLGSVLTEDARWQDDYKGAGPGLYAPAKVVPQFSETLDVIAPDIGMSIRANGKARMGEAEGKKGNIIEAITEGKSVDYVTLPGRGGKVLQLAESKRKSTGVTPMTDEEKLEMQRLKEAVQHLTQQNRANEARSIVSRLLGDYPQVPQATKARLAESLVINVPLTESAAIDTGKLQESVKAAVTAELQYLASLGLGNISGMGNAGTTPTDDPAKLLEAIEAGTKELNDIAKQVSY